MGGHELVEDESGSFKTSVNSISTIGAFDDRFSGPQVPDEIRKPTL